MIPNLPEGKHYCLVPVQFTEDAEFLRQLQQEFLRQLQQEFFDKGYLYPFGGRDLEEDALAFFVEGKKLTYWSTDDTYYEEAELYAKDYGFEEFDLILEPARVVDLNELV